MAKAIPRIVLDTNIFISGLISPVGKPARILRAIRDKKVVHLVSDPIVDEYLRVLEYPHIRRIKGITDVLVAEVASYLIHQTERVELFSVFDLSPDPDDNVFLATAVDGRAPMLVSGDKADLLPLKAVEGTLIVSAASAVLLLGI